MDQSLVYYFILYYRYFNAIVNDRFNIEFYYCHDVLPLLKFLFTVYAGRNLDKTVFSSLSELNYQYCGVVDSKILIHFQALLCML